MANADSTGTYGNPTVVRTLGIDLASQPRQTAACQIAWDAETAVVERIEVGLDDNALCERVARADLSGIDAPFGWPEPFVTWLIQSHGGELSAEAGAAAPTWDADYVRRLRFRVTDFEVHEWTGSWPLSVSTDLISVVAMCCTGLLQRLGVHDKLGGDGVVEVYPALALRLWGIPARGYKGPGNAALRERVLREGVLARCPWLAMTAGQLGQCIRSDHALDSLVSSLIVRCVAVGQVEPIEATQLAITRQEGWIVLPRRDALDHLLSPTTRAAPSPIVRGCAKAAGEVVVDEAGALHEGVADRGADEGEGAPFQFAGEGGGLRREGGNLRR